jgi:hypothetical protein
LSYPKHRKRRTITTKKLRTSKSIEKYLQIKSIAEEVVDRILKERKSQLTSALIAVVEALGMNLDRYAVIYNSKYDNNDNIFDSSIGTTVTAIASSQSTSTKLYQNYYYNKYQECILEIANLLFKILLNQIVDKTMVAAAAIRVSQSVMKL